VALVFDPLAIMGQGVLKGLRRYIRLQTNWQLVTVINTPGGIEDLSTPNFLTFDGIIAPINNPELGRQLRLHSPNVINYSSRMTPPPVPSVVIDDEKTGQMAAEKFLRLGYREFAFVGALPDKSPRGFSEGRYQGYMQRLATAGHTAQVFQYTPVVTATPTPNLAGWQQELARWLASLPTPCGLFACNDDMAVQVVRTAVMFGIAIPTNIALIGVDNDIVKCETPQISITSINQPFDRIGWEAGRVLDQLLQGQTPQPLLRVAPLSVEVRDSTDYVMYRDPLIKAAITFIRGHLREQINATNIAKELKLPRRTLERHFREVLNESPARVLAMYRRQVALDLLLETNWDVAMISRAAGYTSPRIMTLSVQRHTGYAPNGYRRQARHGDAGAMSSDQNPEPGPS
jgi:LacI family transcriptional regulator